jgi:hypothetical protein
MPLARPPEFVVCPLMCQIQAFRYFWPQWLSAGAKRTLSGAITLGGPKETASLVYKALKDGALVRTY